MTHLVTAADLCSIERISLAAAIDWLDLAIDDDNWFAIDDGNWFGVEIETVVAAATAVTAAAAAAATPVAAAAVAVFVAAAIEIGANATVAGSATGFGTALNYSVVERRRRYPLMESNYLERVAVTHHLWTFDWTPLWHFGLDNALSALHSIRAMHLFVAVACATSSTTIDNSLVECWCDIVAAFVSAVDGQTVESLVSLAAVIDSLDWIDVGSSFVHAIGFDFGTAIATADASTTSVTMYFRSNCNCSTADAAQNYLYFCSYLQW